MAAVTPVTGNKCVGSYADGSPNLKFYCQKGLDDDDEPILTCATWKLFRANCPKTSQICSAQSSAWVAAVTVCNQKLF